MVSQRVLTTEKTPQRETTKTLGVSLPGDKLIQGKKMVSFTMRNGIPGVIFRLRTKEDRLVKFFADDFYGRFWVIWAFYSMAQNVLEHLESCTKDECETILDVLQTIISEEMLPSEALEILKKRVVDSGIVKKIEEVAVVDFFPKPEYINEIYNKFRKVDEREGGRDLDMTGFHKLYPHSFKLLEESEVVNLRRMVGGLA